MAMHFHSSALTGKAFALTAHDRSFAVSQWGHRLVAATRLTAFAGRMNVLPDLASVEGLKVLPRADGQAGLDLLAQTEGGSYTALLRDGRQTELDVLPRAQKRGFASGIHYWLPVDEDGRFIFEEGQRHRKVYISGSPTALNAAGIAAHAGVTESAVTREWLIARPIYGGSPEMAVDLSIFEMLFHGLIGGDKQSSSPHFLFERGYTYTRASQYWGAYLRGEDELHPFLFGAWGEGELPYITKGFEWIGLGPRYMAIRDLAFPIFNPRHGYGIIVENCTIEGSHESQFRDVYMTTWKDVVLRNITRVTPGGNPPRTYWDGSNDRISGAYGGSAKNLMLSGCVVDMCGWARGYDFNRNAQFPMPPSDRNHGLYLTFSCSDLTLRDMVISQNASCGVQIRCGGYYERILALDNNLALAIHSGTNLGPINQFSTLTDSVTFGAAHKRVNGFQGALNIGLDVSGYQTSQIGCIVAHRANPDDPAEYAARTNEDRPEWTGGRPYSSAGRFLHNDTQVWEWWEDAQAQPKNENVEGLDIQTLQETTIHRYAGAKLGKTTASIDEYVDWIVQQGSITAAVADTIAWTKARFGRAVPVRTTPADVVFLPDPRVDGFRWDNRFNWTTNTLAGTHVGDTANLGGNFVRFGTLTTAIAALTFNGGSLDVTSGRLTVGTILDEAKVTVDAAGQFVCGATAADVSVKAKAGRVAFMGAASNVNLIAEATSQALLGPDMIIPVGKKLSLGGPNAHVGWDGTGNARLTIHGELEFVTGVTVEVSDALYKQRLVSPGDALVGSDSGMTGFMSLLEERHKSSQNRLHLYGLSAIPVVGEKLTIGHTEYVADDGDYEIPQAVTVTSLLSRTLPQLRRFRSGMMGDGLAAPTVTAQLILAVGSQIAIKGHDLLLPGRYDLTGDGVTVVDQGAILQEGVALMEGRLVLTIMS